MQPNERVYDITPRVVRADRATRITIRPLFDHCRFAPEAT